jgi:hypothetical protein
MHDYKNIPYFTKEIGKDMEKNHSRTDHSVVHNRIKSDIPPHANPLRDCSIKTFYAALKNGRYLYIVRRMQNHLSISSQ